MACDLATVELEHGAEHVKVLDGDPADIYKVKALTLISPVASSNFTNILHFISNRIVSCCAAIGSFLPAGVFGNGKLPLIPCRCISSQITKKISTLYGKLQMEYL